MRKANYGVDAPWISFGFPVFGLSLCAFSFWIHGLQWPGLSFGVTGVVMLYGSLAGKQGMRDRIMKALEGSPKDILDIGCGRGLMLLGAAKRFPEAKAVGIDLWRGVDLSGNSREATMENAVAEGVADRVELVDGDARELPFADESFDLILTCHAIHNIHDEAGRSKAIQEAMRVLRPGGRLEIVDIIAYRLYLRLLKEAGWSPVRAKNFGLFFMPSVWIRASKPQSSAN